MGQKNEKVVLENITKIFKSAGGKEQLVLDNINYNIHENEFISIIGPSGCGKTTLLNIIAGLLTPTEGKVLLNGKIVKGPGKELGMIFQQDTVFMWRTTIKNIEFGLEIQGISKQKRRQIAQNYIKLVGLDGFENYYPKELSGGMRKRVLIATVLANKPDILLMDEPFGSLDYPTKVILQKETLRIWERDKITTIFVTHDIEEALFLSTKIIVLVKGKVSDKIEVPFGYPREDHLRVSPELQKIKEKLWKYLM